MYVYTGTLSYLDYARNELFILIFPRSFISGDPALAFWHWTVSGSGKRNQPTSLRGRIDSVTPSPSSDTTTVRLFQTSFYRLTLLLPHPHPHPSATLLMTFSNQDDSSSADAQVLNLRYVDNDALDLCRVYVGTLSYFEYALSTPIVFVLPRGKWEKGEKIGVYWQWTVDAAGTRKVVSNNQGSVDWSVEEGGGERRVGFLGELYYSFVGEVRGEGEEGERMSFTMWNRSRTDKGSVLGRLLYAGAKLELPAPLMSTSFTPASSFSSTPASTPTPASIPASTATLTSPSTSTSTIASTSTFPSTSTSTSTSASISTHPLSAVEPFHLTTTFHPHSVTHPSPTHPPSLSHPSTPQHSQAGTWTDTRPIGSGGFGVVTLQTCSDRGGQLRAVKKLPLGMRGVDYHRELRSLATLSDVFTKSFFFLSTFSFSFSFSL
ncbi:hypothetical protein P167DRAFT_537282 [Morchella conica CCBAS932]|uniref:Protein kinase domain-containing protein n=1 Tax=Morchella conica CCBAS932 TaxID=1392247 RepID=A0A3N4KN48_9PEZI|nr:hypothetical protein P167DRAFT_537282 [Morchella conica CCBAS932]